MGWLKNFIHNRNLASENLMRGYNTTTMVRHMPPEDMADLRRRLASAPSYTKAGVDRMLPLPERRLQGGKKGSGVVAIKPSRRNRKNKLTHGGLAKTWRAAAGVYKNGLAAGSAYPQDRLCDEDGCGDQRSRLAGG